MRGAVLWLLLLAACSAREECAMTCEGCCDVSGQCHPGTDPYACGSAGDCRVCLPGQACVPDAGCTGTELRAVLQLTGTNSFVPITAQAFTYGETQTPFILASNRDRKVCRDPSVPPNVDETVLIVGASGQSTPSLELVTFSDAGVERTALIGQVTIRNLGSRVTSTVDIDQTLHLEGSIDAPFCGAFH